MTNTIYQGDALSVLKTLPNESINMCMTSPPYWALRDYGTATWEGGKEDCNHIDISAIGGQGSASVKQHTSQGTQNIQYKEKCKRCGAKRIDKQLGLEPTFDEYINQLCDIFDEVKRVLRKDGTCWVNLGDTYSGGNRAKGGADKGNIEPKYKNKTKSNYAPNRLGCGVADKSLVMIPFRFAIEMLNRGWILRNTIIWHKNNCMPCSAKDRFTVDFEYLFFFSKSKKYYFEQQFEPHKRLWDETNGGSLVGGTNWLGDASVKSTNRKDRKLSLPNLEGRNKRTVWNINTKPFKDAHFAVYPEELCQTPIKAGCPEKGVVLDPFFGSGTTGVVASKLNRDYIGIELNPEYIKIAEKRLEPYKNQMRLGDKTKEREKE